MVVLHAVPEVPLSSGYWSAACPPELVDRVWASKAQARRRWAIRTCLFLGITGLVLTLLVFWQRDTVALQELTWKTEASCRAIQAHLDKLGLLPPNLPPGTPANFAYLSYADRFYAQHESHPVILAVSPPVSLKLRPNGRAIIMYDQGKVYQQWMTADAFAEAWEAQTRDAEQFEQQRRARPLKLP